MKKIKRKRGERVQDYEFTDYRGVKIMTNNKASVHLFGAAEPDKATIDIITSLLMKPDFVFSHFSDPYPNFNYFKCINGFDYILETKPGYGEADGEFDKARNAIMGLKKYTAYDGIRRVLYRDMRLEKTSLRFFSYSANFYPN